MPAFNKVYSLLTVGSAITTSSPIFVGDAAAIGLSLLTATAASTYTVQGSIADGFAAAIPANTWSTVTLLTAQGLYAVQTGMRWLRALQSQSTSSATVQVHKEVR